MASGRPIISISDNVSELSKIISCAEVGVNVENGHELAKTIQKLKNNKFLREQMSEKGRVYALQHFSRKDTTLKYINLLGS